MTKKWLTPFTAILLGVLGLLPSITPTSGLIWAGLAQATAAPSSADEKQLLTKEARSSAAAMIIATSYLEAAIDDTGNFTCGIPGGAILLYGHPSPWSSASTIRVDGIDHWNYSKNVFGTAITAPHNVDAVTNESVWDIDGKVKVTENLQIIDGDSGNADTLQISYTALNQDTVAHDVGVRIMLDTMLGAVDGAPFRIPEVGEVTMEKEFTGADVPIYWEAFESLTDITTAKARGTLINADDMPTRVVFADWSIINVSPWDFVVDATKPVTGDSAVGVYWDPVAVQPGQSITRTTFYGLSGMAVNGNVALSMPASLSVENGAYVPNPFPVTAYVTNNGTLAMSGVTATLTLPAGLALDAGETLTKTIGTVALRDSQQVSWSVSATGAPTGTLTVSALIKGTNLPAKTVSADIFVPVKTVATTTTLNVVPSPADPGQDVTLKAAVTAANGAVPTGNVTFSVDGATVATPALTAGAADYVASGLTPGAHTAAANYAGDATFDPSGAQAVVTVKMPAVTTTAVTATPSATIAGQVALSVKVTADNGATPTGSVTFAVDGTAMPAVALDATGTAAYTANGLAVGAHTVTVSYAGTASFGSSTGQTTVTVPMIKTATTTTLTAVQTSPTTGQVALTAKVTATNGAIPTGNVNFVVDNSPVTPAVALDANGTAVYTTANLAAGAHTATANYVGATGFNASTAQTSFAVIINVGCTLPPTAVTNPAVSITTTSATLVGKATPNGCNTTVEFDFGVNNAYGTTVLATPGSLASAAPSTMVQTSKTGLESCTEYHYRTVATNVVGSVYGADQMFKTICTTVDINADAWLYRPNPIVTVGKAFTQDVHVNTHGGLLGAFDVTINFDNTKMLVDTMFQNADNTCYTSLDAQGNPVSTGVCPGTGALSGAFVTTDNATGTIKVAAFDAMGTGPSNDLQAVVIHFIARNVTGLHDIDLTVLDLLDPLDGKIGGQVGRGSHVAISSGLCGDSDGTGVVNIVDALAIARSLVGLPPPPTINPLLADVNLDGRPAIGDALNIARYSVGLQVGAVNGCSIGTPYMP